MKTSVSKAASALSRRSARTFASSGGARSADAETAWWPPRREKRYPSLSSTGGAASACGSTSFPNVNARYKPDEHRPLPRLAEVEEPAGAGLTHWMGPWSDAELRSASEEHVMLSWGPSAPAKDLPIIVDAKGIYLYDSEGKEYLDWTSQAVCSNFGHDVPSVVMDAVREQMENVPYMYSGMGVVPVRARLAKLMAELMPGDINGFLFPCGGSEANEAAIRIARRFTGRHKVMNQYRSYHGGSASALGATGDFRRAFNEGSVNGFVKVFNPQPQGFSWGTTDEEVTRLSLQALEEQVLLEGPETIAAVMMESIVGSGGVLVPPVGYMEGVRALCDKYDILLIMDEVMAGFGRTGEMFAFQHFDNVLPDIVTSAKGLTGALLPMSVVGVREEIRQWSLTHPIGWGATYHAHPVAMACAYESVKWMVEQKLPERAKALEPVMMEEINALVERHPSVKAGRAIGLFGCVDLQGPDGRAVQQLGMPFSPPVRTLKAALTRNGIMGMFRPPLLHCTPPLVITEEELRDGFDRVSRSLGEMDAEMC